MEEYYAFKDDNIFHQMGSFSYSKSSLPHCTKVGRYCSIADGVNMFSFKHTMDRIALLVLPMKKIIVLLMTLV